MGQIKMFQNCINTTRINRWNSFHLETPQILFFLFSLLIFLAVFLKYFSLFLLLGSGLVRVGILKWKEEIRKDFWITSGNIGGTNNKKTATGNVLSLMIIHSPLYFEQVSTKKKSLRFAECVWNLYERTTKLHGRKKHCIYPIYPYQNIQFLFYIRRNIWFLCVSG